MIPRSDFRETPALHEVLLVALFLAGLVTGCSRGKGVYHRIERGQTAYRIAKTYGIEPQELLEANEIADPKTLQPGQMLWIPGATGTKTVPPVRVEVQRSRISGKKFIMPLRGTISSRFGMRNGRMHEGIDILAPGGTVVRSAGYGVVLYAGDGMQGYGNAIIVDHGDGVTTLYGHLKRFRVRSGDAVGAGSVIGTVGDTGNATTTHLHFELRVGKEEVDPEKYLEKVEKRR
ncbi:MAG: LysM peptidoglycan-binding domain-containing M23 family metallopeptidase [Candidatus Deferrimicrobiaceae bacterium]